MKRRVWLLTGLISIGVSTPILASENLSLQLGEIEFWARVTAAAQGGTFDAPNGSGNETDGHLDASLRLNGEWIADNRWILGVRFEIDSSNREAEELKRDEFYGYFSSEYGRVEFGEQDGAADVLSFHAPVVGLGQIRGDFSRYAGTLAFLSPLDTSDELKLTYLSAPVYGLRGGISWSPSFKSNANDPDPRDRTLVDKVFELGLQFQQPVGDWVLGLSGAYVTGQAEAITTRADWNSWSIGAEARRGPLVIGAAYVNRGDSNRRARNFDQWEINGGVGWLKDEWGAGLSASTTQSSSNKSNLLGLGGYYSLTSFLTLRTDAVYINEKENGARSRDGIVVLAEIEFRY
jgi:Gram-negative porin